MSPKSENLKLVLQFSSLPFEWSQTATDDRPERRSNAGEFAFELDRPFGS